MATRKILDPDVTKSVIFTKENEKKENFVKHMEKSKKLKMSFSYPLDTSSLQIAKEVYIPHYGE